LKEPGILFPDWKKIEGQSGVQVRTHEDCGSIFDDVRPAKDEGYARTLFRCTPKQLSKYTLLVYPWSIIKNKPFASLI